MRLARRFLQLSTEERALLVRALLLLVLMRLWLPFASLDRLRQWARPGKTAVQPASTIVWAVRTGARWLPGTPCLPAALVLQRLLCAAGHQSELHIGVTQEGGRFAAHAWVSRASEVLIGDDTPTTYSTLLFWR
jgi:Transglutaminase-like superfamily